MCVIKKAVRLVMFAISGVIQPAMCATEPGFCHAMFVTKPAIRPAMCVINRGLSIAIPVTEQVRWRAGYCVVNASGRAGSH